MKWLLPVALALVATAAQTGDDKAKVNTLLIQLENGPTASKRIAAEWELLKLGPDILPLLTSLETASPNLKERLAGITATLEELRPRTWKIAESQKLTLADAGKLLQKSTGLKLVDRRQDSKAGDVNILAGTASYWEIAESLAKQTGSRMSFYQMDGQVALVDGPTSKEPVALHGPFRIAVKRVRTSLDFDSKSHTGVLGLEIAWEPRFMPYLIEVRKVSMASGLTKSQEEKPVVVPGGSPVRVTEHNAKEFDIFFPPPPRAAASMRDVAGHVVVTMPVKTLTFAFKEAKQGDKQVHDGVQLTLRKIAADGEHWTVEWTLDVPEAGPKFESFQAWLGGKSWLDQCDCYFERGAGENIQLLRPNPLHTQIVGRPSATRATVSYQFMPPKSGELASWRLICRVPGRMVEVTVPFSFAEIALP